jgi:putative glutathione S-transferase
VSATLALRGLLGDSISCTTLDDNPEKASRGGWCFAPSDPDPLLGAADLKAVYDACTEGGSYTGRCTAPLLVDLETCTIISNESADIVRILNQFDPTDASGRVDAADVGRVIDLYPASLAASIDETNAWVYEQVNNGVYRAGFATRQAAYEQAERDVHSGLARCDALLAGSRFLCGARVTEADVRLLPTALRFDGVYASFFRCGRKQIRSDYPNVARWAKEMLSLTGPGLFSLADARRSYYTNLFPLNPGGIVPAGPTEDDLGFAEAAAAAAAASARDESAFEWRERASSMVA